MQQIKGNWLKYTDKQKDSLKALFKAYKAESFKVSLFLDCKGLKYKKTEQNIGLGEIILTTKEVSLTGKGLKMSIEERMAKLEATVEFILSRMDRMVDFEFHMLYLLIGGLAAIAFILVKKWSKDDE